VRRYFMHVGMTFADLHTTALLVAVTPSYVVAASSVTATRRRLAPRLLNAEGELLALLRWLRWSSSRRWLTSLRPGPRQIEGYEACSPISRYPHFI
jgi:hypothetical protein